MAATKTGGKCDRTYLEGLVDNYLKAVVAHDPAEVPLAKKVKYTENTQQIEIGDGLWATASDLPTYKLYVCDPANCQVGFFGLMKENGFLILISLRLKSEKGLITEIEAIIVRNPERPPSTQYLIKPHEVYLQALKPSENVTREELIRISDLYFDGLVQNNGDIVPFAKGCNRIENGMQTTNNPDLKFPGSDAPSGFAVDARTQINNRTFAYISEINPRRYSVVDEERGITFGTFMFHHKGTVNWVTTPDGRKIQMIPIARQPFSVIVSEIFKIKKGQIQQIEAIMTQVPYRSKDGWER